MNKVTIIRTIIIAMFVFSFVSFIAIDAIFGNPYLNLIYFGFIFVVWCGGGAYISDYVIEHNLFNEVLGKHLVEFFSADEDFED